MNAPAEPVYQGYTQAEMEVHFNPQNAVADHAQWSEKKNQASQKVRAGLKSFLDVPYGGSPRQKIDIFPAARPGAPVLLYFHGGYWRGGAKEQNCHFAELFTGAGAAVAVAGYDLCPSVTVGDIVGQARAAVAWVYKNIARYGGDPEKLYLVGQSAGGHLVAMALAHDWEKAGLPPDIVKGATAITGVYDLDAVLHIGVNEEIRLTPESARENSPFFHPPLPRAPLTVVVGGAEPRGWREQSQKFFALCKERGLACEYLEIAGANHYSLGAHLADAGSPLPRAILKQMGLSGALP